MCTPAEPLDLVFAWPKVLCPRWCKIDCDGCCLLLCLRYAIGLRSCRFKTHFDWKYHPCSARSAADALALRQQLQEEQEDMRLHELTSKRKPKLFIGRGRGRRGGTIRGRGGKRPGGPDKAVVGQRQMQSFRQSFVVPRAPASAAGGGASKGAK